MACVSPSISAATTVTPVTNCPTVRRNVRGSTSATWLPRSQLSADGGDIIRTNEIRGRPAVEVVFGHAPFREPFVAGRSAGDIRHRQRLEANAFMVAKVVPLVQLVSSTELAANSVP